MYKGLVLFILLCGLGVSCTTTYSTSVQTLTPAGKTFPQKTSTLTLLGREGYHFSSDVKTEHDKEDLDTMILNTLHSLSDLLKEQPLYENAAIEIVKRPYEGFPPASEYSSLFDEYSVDQIVLIDSVFVKDNIIRSQEFGLFYLVYELSTALRWNVLLRDTPGIADQWITRDTLRWVGAGSQMRDALSELPSRNDALWDAGISIAKAYSARISPVWTPEPRTIYCLGSLSHLGRAEYQAGNIREAITLWSDLFEKTGSARQKALLSHNLAVSWESLDDLEKADEWIQKALVFLQSSRKSKIGEKISSSEDIESSVKQYAARIKQRIQEREKLSNQILPD